MLAMYQESLYYQYNDASSAEVLLPIDSLCFWLKKSQKNLSSYWAQGFKDVVQGEHISIKVGYEVIRLELFQFDA